MLGFSQEEEVRRKAMIVKHKHSGPIIRQHSKIVNGVEKVCKPGLHEHASFLELKSFSTLSARSFRACCKQL